jgi:hypothetical protein
MAVGVPTTNTIPPASPEGYIFKSKSGVPMIITGAQYLQYGPTAALATSTTETSLLNNTATTAFGTPSWGTAGLTNDWNLPNLAGAGSMYRFKAGGIIANTSTPNLTIRLTVTNAAGTVSTLSTTGALATVAITGTANWFIEAMIICTAYSATVGSFLTMGRFDYGQTTLLTTGLNLPSTTLGSLDTTSYFALDAKATWGTSSSSNTMTCQWATLEMLN